MDVPEVEAHLGKVVVRLIELLELTDFEAEEEQVTEGQEYERCTR